MGDEVEEDIRFESADYVLELPNQLDEYGMPKAESYRDRVDVIKNLLAAGLTVSWFTTEDESTCIVRVSAPYERLAQEAEEMEPPFMVRSQDKYRDNYVPENETFVKYREVDRSLYSNAFTKFGPYRFCSLERMRLVHRIMMAPHNENGADLGSLNDMITDMYPMHNDSEIEFLEALWFENSSWVSYFSAFVPEKEIRDYFGEKIALYVVFAGFYTSRLAMLVPLGIICKIAQVVDGENTLVTPMYAMAVALWATFFLEYWKQRESSLRCQWNVEDYESQEQVRPEFYGDQDPRITGTGKEVVVYSPWKRYLKLALSMSVLLVLAVTVLMSTLCLMVVRVLTTSTNGTAGMVIVGVVNFVMIETMNKVYVRIAKRMTDWENHATQTQYDDQLIAKCFVFQFFNSYSSFFYLAFLEGHARIFGVKDTCPHDDCMASLGVQLATIFVMHTVFGQIVEVFWPWFQGYYEEAKYECHTTTKLFCRNVVRRLKAYFCNIPIEEDEEEDMDLSSNVYTDEEQNGFRPTFPGVLVDYNELVLQYGYVTLFAPAFPLASLLATLNNIVELRSDGFKICKFYRRPEYVCAQDIGSWQYIIEVISVVAIITNAGIIAFTSSALARFHVVGRNDRLAQVLIAFMAEHAILLIKVIIHIVIEDDPEHVIERRQKRAWEVKKMLLIEEAEETQDELYEFRQRFVEAPDEYEQHVDLP